MTESGFALSPGARLGHAWRVGSARAVAIALADGALESVFGGWWRRHGPWYGARLSRIFGSAVAIDGLTIEFPPSMLTIPRGLAWLGVYETPERYAVARFLDRSLPVVELGGSAGIVACMTNRLIASPKAHVVVEANPAMAALLERNRIANGCAFTVVNQAVAYGSESVEFQVAANHLASSLQTETGVKVRVPSTTLAALLDSHGFATCNLVCDIEGAEMEVVKRESAALRHKVAAVVMEVHPGFVGAEAVEGLRRDLEALGFVIRWRGADVWYLRNQKL